MAVSHIQKADNDGTESEASGVSSLTVYFDSDTTSGNTLVAGAGSWDSSNATLQFSDSGGHSWTRPIHQASSTNGRTALGYVEGITGESSHSVTVTPTGSCDLQLKAVEIGPSTYAGSNSSSGTEGGTASTGGVTAGAGDYAYARCDDEEGDPGTATWSGSTVLGNQDYSTSSYKVSAGATENPTWSLTSGDDWAAGIIYFEQASSTYSLSGTTKDKTGSALGSCEVFLLQDNGDSTMSFLAHTTSNATTGAYSFTGLSVSTGLCVVAWKDDSPHVMDATDWVLTGTPE